jgi:hypothetical protein
MVTLTVVKIIVSKKIGKSFVPEQECSFLQVLQDLILEAIVRSATHFERGFANNTTKSPSFLCI